MSVKESQVLESRPGHRQGNQNRDNLLPGCPRWEKTLKNRQVD